MLRTSRLIPATLVGLLIACSDSPNEPARTPSSILLNETVLVLDDGATAHLSATIKDQNGQAYSTPPRGFTLSWSSEDANIASVSQAGLVQANRPGETEVRATAGSLQASASVTVRMVASVLQVVEGNPQQGTVGTALPNAIVVRVADRHGSGVPEVIVRFAAAQGGSFAPDSTATDAQGLARSAWTLGTTAGVNSATVSSPGTTALTLNIQAVPGPAAAIEVSPATSRVIRNKRVQLSARAFDQYGNQIPSPALQWASSNTSVATVSTAGLVQTNGNGTTEISARLGEIGGSAAIEAYSVEHETVSAFLATPAAGHLWEVPVLVMSYLPTADGDTIDVAWAPDHWSLNPISLERLKQDIDRFNHRIKFSLEEGSRFRGYKDPSAQPSLGYRVVASITVYEPIPAGPPIGVAPDIVYLPDFHSIFERFDVRRYVEEMGVKEIWFWQSGFGMGTPSYDPAIHKPENARMAWESNMASPTTGDISNSNRDPNDLPIYSSTYVVYGYNFRRSQAEAVHNHGHQLEARFSHAGWRQDGNTDLFWKQFVGQDAAGNFITGRAGWTHMPPNTTGNYDYLKPALVSSDIEEWRPDNSGAKTMVNVDTWGMKNYGWPGVPDFGQRTESQWYIYWMQNMPGRDNNIPHEQHLMTNWWEFVGDWDGAMQRRLGLHTGPAAPGVRSAFTLERHVEPLPKR